MWDFQNVTLVNEIKISCKAQFGWINANMPQVLYCKMPRRFAMCLTNQAFIVQAVGAIAFISFHLFYFFLYHSWPSFRSSSPYPLRTSSGLLWRLSNGCAASSCARGRWNGDGRGCEGCAARLGGQYGPEERRSGCC